MSHDPRARICAKNNADYYEALLSAHGTAYQRDEACLYTSQRPPPYLSSMVTLDPMATDIQKDRIKALRRKGANGFGLKDGFCLLDLADDRFNVLFEAQWVWAAAHTFAPSKSAEWQRIANPRELALWEEAWKRFGSPTPARMFPEALLSRDDIAFFGQAGSDGYRAGFIANKSADSVGLSNIFSSEEVGQSLIKSAGATIADFCPGLPIVGFDHDTMLDEMVRAGFETVGPLRIWVCDSGEHASPD